MVLRTTVGFCANTQKQPRGVTPGHTCDDTLHDTLHIVFMQAPCTGRRSGRIADSCSSSTRSLALLR